MMKPKDLTRMKIEEGAALGPDGPDSWVPLEPVTDYVISRVIMGVRAGSEVDMTFELDRKEYPDWAFQARLLYCREISGTFKILPSFVVIDWIVNDDRAWPALAVETPATLALFGMNLLSHQLCKPGEEICVRVRNEGKEAGSLRMGLVGYLWKRGRQPWDQR